jgi:hypothetical protein
MRALAYLEWRFALHQIAAIGRSPLRLAIWIPYALSLGYLACARLFGSHEMLFGSAQLSAEHLTGIGGLYLGALGITVALSAGGRVSGFRTSAEAVLFSNAGIKPIDMAVWLQFRKLLASGLRWAGVLAYYFLIFFPRHASPLGATIAFLTALLAVALLMSVELPIFLLSRGSFNLGFRGFGWILAATGFAYVAIGFSGARVWKTAIGFVRCDPGGAVRSIQRGSPSALILFCALLAFMLIAIVCLAHDSLPELYAVSRRSLADVRRRQSAVRQTRYGAVVSTPAARIPSGALALAWKDWIGFRRGRGSFALWIGGCVFWAACGVGFAYASIALDDLSPMLTLFGASALLLVFLAPHGAAAGLAGDLGKPLFWLGQDALRSRLAAWTLGRALRGGVALGLAPLCAGLVLNQPALTLAALPVCLAAYWSLQALGIGLYALFPNPIDSRGPMALVRTLVTAAYILPALALGGAAAALGGSPATVGASVCFTFVALGFLTIGFAAHRFGERGAAMALIAESA